MYVSIFRILLCSKYVRKYILHTCTLISINKQRMKFPTSLRFQIFNGHCLFLNKDKYRYIFLTGLFSRKQSTMLIFSTNNLSVSQFFITCLKNDSYKVELNVSKCEQVNLMVHQFFNRYIMTILSKLSNSAEYSNNMKENYSKIHSDAY